MKKLYILILIALSIGFGQENSEKKEAKQNEKTSYRSPNKTTMSGLFFFKMLEKFIIDFPQYLITSSKEVWFIFKGQE